MVDELQRSMNGERVGVAVDEKTAAHFSGCLPPIVDIALKAGSELNLKLTAIKNALLDGDEATAMNLARELFRLDDKGHYAD